MVESVVLDLELKCPQISGLFTFSGKSNLSRICKVLEKKKKITVIVTFSRFGNQNSGEPCVGNGNQYRSCNT